MLVVLLFLEVIYLHEEATVCFLYVYYPYPYYLHVYYRKRS